MILNPPIKLKNVEVTALNLSKKMIRIIVHLKPCDPIEAHSQVQGKIQFALNYLLSEGFIGEGLHWETHIACVWHNEQI